MIERSFLDRKNLLQQLARNSRENSNVNDNNTLITKIKQEV